jgi:alkylation response protein AidB-like acyl-CoA dehydrogenase
MDYRFTDTQEKFREEIRAFLKQELKSDEEQGEEASSDADWAFARAFQKKLAAKGWLVPHWPKQYGGNDMGIMDQVILKEELAYSRAPLTDFFGINMLGPVLMMYGTDEQKKEHLPGIATADVTWSQGYSEPGSGSDLASLQTKAVRDGDDYVINGQKIWNSNAHRADWMFLLARTDPDAPKHKGITFFLTPTSAPGFSTRPLINMAGIHYFNETYFEDLRIPAKNVVGEVNRGWYVGAALLDFERSGIGNSALVRRGLDDLMTYMRESGNGNGNGNSPEHRNVKNLLAELVIESEVGRFLSYRVASMQARGEVPNAEASMAKLYLSELAHRVYNAGVKVMGLYGPLRPESGKWSRLKGGYGMGYMVSLGGMIAGGTSEIQRNIIAQRGLGLQRG